MANDFQDCKVREVNSITLCWKIYWYWLRNFNNLFLFLLLCTQIILIFLPLILSGFDGIGATFVTLVFAFFPSLICLISLWAFIYFSSLGKVHKMWILEKSGKSIAVAHCDFKYGFSCLLFLSVAKNFRGKGYGSYLVRWLRLHVAKPIYVVATSKSTEFYAKLGFSFPSIEQLPTRFRSNIESNKTYRIRVMMYE
jgi:GNAT superfamily N-acetyltransferase